MYKIYPYKMSSQSSKALSTVLETNRVYPNRAYRPRSNHIVINWGNSQVPSWRMTTCLRHFLNHPHKVAIACNKLLTFKYLEEAGVSIPNFVTHKNVALALINKGHKIYCRTTLTGHSGRGIIVATTAEELVNAPLYTKATKADKEFRVHVMNGHIIDFVQKKKRQNSETEANPNIKSHAHGWIFTRENVVLPQCVAENSLAAIRALGLDFGAVDIGYKSNTNTPFVYEVNTAPGLTGTTIERYKEGFLTHYPI